MTGCLRIALAVIGIALGRRLEQEWRARATHDTKNF
jgi:hypothetical protein